MIYMGRKAVIMHDRSCPNCDCPNMSYYEDLHVWACLNCDYQEEGDITKEVDPKDETAES